MAKISCSGETGPGTRTAPQVRRRPKAPVPAGPKGLTHIAEPPREQTPRFPLGVPVREVSAAAKTAKRIGARVKGLEKVLAEPTPRAGVPPLHGAEPPVKGVGVEPFRRRIREKPFLSAAVTP